MTASDMKAGAAALLSALQRGEELLPAFLALYRFIHASDDAGLGWYSLGDEQVLGVECDLAIGQWNAALIECIRTGAKFADYLKIAKLRAALESIQSTGRVTPENSKHIVIALRVIEAAFRGVHLAEVSGVSDSLAVADMRTALRKGLPLTSDETYSVFPRPRRLARSDERGQCVLSDFLDVLCVVQTEPQMTIRYQATFGDYDAGLGGFERIGIVPAINNASELEWRREANNKYSIQENLAVEYEVHQRVIQALDALLAVNVDVILLPELVSGPRLLAMIKKHLARQALGGKRMPILVLAGSQLVKDADDRIRNRAHVLSGEGDEVWYQDKLHAYRFSANEQKNAGYPLGPDDVVDRVENISITPRTLQVVDVSPSLRVVVLICEDLKQPLPHADKVHELCVTSILVPIMSGERAKPPTEGWVSRGVMTYVDHPGAACIVANSSTLILKVASTNQPWHYSEIRANPQVKPAWKRIPASRKAPLLAWLATIPRPI